MDAGGETSSTGDTRPPEIMDEPLDFPKLSFHFEGFFVTEGTDMEEEDTVAGRAGTGGTVVEARGIEAKAAGRLGTDGVKGEGIDVKEVLVDVVGDGGLLLLPEHKGVGTANMDTGSRDCCLRRDRADSVDSLVPSEATDIRDEALDALLISRASDSDATASVTRVSSLGVVGVVAIAPLPFLAPRFRLLFVEVDREVMPASSCSSSCSSTSWSITVESSDASGRSYAGPNDGARESERGGMAGVRIAVDIPEACLDDGRCEAGVLDDIG